MNGNKQTGLTHLHVYTFVIYSNGAWDCCLCIIHNGLPKPQENTWQQFPRFSQILMEVLRMETHIRTVRFNPNPLNFFLGNERKKGLRIGYMEATLNGFYINSMDTGVHPQKLSRFLSEDFHCTDTESVTGLLQFLINEGDRFPIKSCSPISYRQATSASSRKSFKNVSSEWSASFSRERIYTIS